MKKLTITLADKLLNHENNVALAIQPKPKPARRKLTFAIVAFVPFLAQVAAFGAQIVGEEVIAPNHSDAAYFYLTYNYPPNFFSVTSYGIQADDFQFVIFQSAEIIRGTEINVFGEIPIRNAGPPSSDPSSDGWGSIISLVPFTISGDSVSFSVPLDVLGVSGDFSYSVQSDYYGSENFYRLGEAITVPDSPSKVILVISCLGMVSMSFLTKRKITVPRAAR